MKKLFSLMILGLLVLSIGTVSAYTLIAGKIYDYNYQNTIEGASVIVSCAHNTSSGIIINTQNTTSLSNGVYFVEFSESVNSGCDGGDIVTVSATKDGLYGSNSGVVHENVVETLDLAIVNVPLVPEFGFFIGALTLLSAVGVFFIIRRE